MSDKKDVTLTQDQFNNLMARLNKLENEDHSSKTEITRPESGYDHQGKPTGVIQRYSLDISHYDDPRDFLYDLPELKRQAMRENYELTWDVEQQFYDTKWGTSMVDPKFVITLKRILFDDEDKDTKKRIILQTGVFFEDPAASVKEAVDLGLPIDNSNTPEFLAQMRKLRYKQWLLDYFNPKLPTSTKAQTTDHVIDGKVYTIEDYSNVT